MKKNVWFDFRYACTSSDQNVLTEEEAQRQMNCALSNYTFRLTDNTSLTPPPPPKKKKKKKNPSRGNQSYMYFIAHIVAVESISTWNERYSLDYVWNRLNGCDSMQTDSGPGLPRYGDSHYIDKTAVRPYLCNWNPFTDTVISLYWNSPLYS